MAEVFGPWNLVLEHGAPIRWLRSPVLSNYLVRLEIGTVPGSSFSIKFNASPADISSGVIVSGHMVSDSDVIYHISDPDYTSEIQHVLQQKPDRWEFLVRENDCCLFFNSKRSHTRFKSKSNQGLIGVFFSGPMDATVELKKISIISFPVAGIPRQPLQHEMRRFAVKYSKREPRNKFKNRPTCQPSNLLELAQNLNK